MTQLFRHKTVVGIYILLALLYAAYGIVKVAQGLGELLRRRSIVVMICVTLLAAPSLSYAFKFKIQNNIDQPVLYLLHTDEKNVSADEIGPNSTKTLCCDHDPNKYHIIWYDPNEEWGAKASFEIPGDTTRGQTVTISIDPVPLTITIK